MAEDKFQQPPDGNPGGNAPGPFANHARTNPTSAAPVSSSTPASRKGPGPNDMKDGSREIVETIVFVVILVLLLKTFLAEAFVIPTGSMATTLLGYHQEVTCDMCGIRYLVNGSSEGEDEDPYIVTKSQCQNCLYWNVLRPVLPRGDQPR